MIIIMIVTTIMITSMPMIVIMINNATDTLGIAHGAVARDVDEVRLGHVDAAVLRGAAEGRRFIRES